MILTLSSPSLLQLDLLVYCPLTSPQTKRGDLDLESWEVNHLTGCASRWSRATRAGSALETAAVFRFSDRSVLNSYMFFIEKNVTPCSLKAKAQQNFELAVRFAASDTP